MKKVLDFIGSPRRNGNTAALVRAVTRGAQDAGAEVKIYNLYDMTIKPCLGCFCCKKMVNSEALCTIKNDDMQSVYKDLQEADVVVIGSPVYMYQITAQAKLLIDRLFATIVKDGDYFKPRFGIKSTVMVYSYGEANADRFKQSFDVNANLFEILGFNIIKTIASSSANELQTAINNQEPMDKAFQDGIELVTN